MIGTTSSQGEIWKVLFSASVYVSTDSVRLLLPIQMPANPKITSEMNMLGRVVRSMYRMCWKSGVPLLELANTVVSESGEILSPK